MKAKEYGDEKTVVGFVYGVHGGVLRYGLWQRKSAVCRDRRNEDSFYDSRGVIEG
jgi:hypothetical protein